MTSVWEDVVSDFRKKASRDMTLTGLKTAIIVWALFIILLAIFIDNKWLLGGILAYEILP
jgi:hypothetical protein